jgi:uncharacterized iron-regulated protein
MKLRTFSILVGYGLGFTLAGGGSQAASLSSLEKAGSVAADTTLQRVAASASPIGTGADAAVLGSKVIDLVGLRDLDSLVPKLASKQVIFIGEQHDRFDHHLNQLAIIRGLYALDPDLAIGMEFFQQPFQRYLDEYVAGRLGEKDLLIKSEYFDRWRFDFRLYQPILEFARAHQIPLIALNVAQEIVDKVSSQGLLGLTQEDRQQIPQEIDRSDTAYRQRLQEVFQHHPGSEQKDFERFLEVQLLWDETMAEQAAEYLAAHPRRTLVVLAGNGHLLYGAGIPQRLQRRIRVDSAIVLNGSENGISPSIADYILLSEERPLPPAGKLGVILDPLEQGLQIRAFASPSVAATAGMQKGDWIMSVDGQPIQTMSDLKVSLWNRQPGDHVSLEVRREGWFGSMQHRYYELQLQ